MRDEKETKGPKGSTTNKVRKLQKQYNKILVDLFDQFAAESIEEALDQNEGSFGENIQSIVQAALDNLKGKVMEELGVSGGGGIDIAAGGPMGIEIGAIMGTDEGDDTESETSESESESEDKEEETTEDESDDKTEELEESQVRKSDAQLISEAYMKMHKKT